MKQDASFCTNFQFETSTLINIIPGLKNNVFSILKYKPRRLPYNRLCIQSIKNFCTQKSKLIIVICQRVTVADPGGGSGGSAPPGPLLSDHRWFVLQLLSTLKLKLVQRKDHIQHSSGTVNYVTKSRPCLNLSQMEFTKTCERRRRMEISTYKSSSTLEGKSNYLFPDGIVFCYSFRGWRQTKKEALTEIQLSFSKANIRQIRRETYRCKI